MISLEELDWWTATALRSELERRGHPTAGRKKDLVKRLGALIFADNHGNDSTPTLYENWTLLALRQELAKREGMRVPSNMGRSAVEKRLHEVEAKAKAKTSASKRRSSVGDSKVKSSTLSSSSSPTASSRSRTRLSLGSSIASASASSNKNAEKSPGRLSGRRRDASENGTKATPSSPRPSKKPRRGTTFAVSSSEGDGDDSSGETGIERPESPNPPGSPEKHFLRLQASSGASKALFTDGSDEDTMPAILPAQQLEVAPDSAPLEPTFSSQRPRQQTVAYSSPSLPRPRPLDSAAPHARVPTPVLKSPFQRRKTPLDADKPSTPSKVKFHQVEVREYDRTPGGSRGVPSQGSYALGLDWTVAKTSTTPIKDYERIRKPRRHSTDTIPRLDESRRKALLGDTATPEVINAQRAEFDALRLSREMVGCDCAPGVDGQCCDKNSDCPCAEGGAHCHEDACMCMETACGNDYYSFDEYSVEAFRERRLRQLKDDPHHFADYRQPPTAAAAVQQAQQDSAAAASSSGGSPFRTIPRSGFNFFSIFG